MAHPVEGIFGGNLLLLSNYQGIELTLDSVYVHVDMYMHAERACMYPSLIMYRHVVHVWASYKCTASVAPWAGP